MDFMAKDDQDRIKIVHWPLFKLGKTKTHSAITRSGGVLINLGPPSRPDRGCRTECAHAGSQAASRPSTTERA